MQSPTVDGMRRLSASTAIVCLLHATFLYSMVRWLLDRDHYQFFPLILIGSGVLAWFRLEGAEWPKTATCSLRVMLYAVMAFAVFLLANIAGSDWLGTLGALWALWTCVWFFGGADIADRLRGPVFFLLLAVPIPLNLDLQLIIGMQKVASESASRLLDLRNIPHTLSGVALQTPSREYMVEEACSGIHSLFSSLAAMSFWAVVFRYGLFRVFLTLLQTTGWVLVANSVRVFSIVFCRERWGIDLESGMPHQLLGVGTYAMALTLALSTDQLLRFMRPVDAGTANDFKKRSQDSMNDSIAYNIRTFVADFRKFLDRARTKARTGQRLAIGLLACYLPFSGYSVIAELLSSKAEVTNIDQFEKSITELIDEGSLPKSIEGWKLVNAETVLRQLNDPLGTNSVIWTYEGQGMSVDFSVDGFYPSWHDLSYCYTALGWKLESADNLDLGDSEARVSQLTLYRDSGDYAISLFACFDSNCKAVEPPEASGTTIRRLIDRLKSGKLVAEAKQDIVPPVFQVQLMTSRQSPLMAHELEAVKILFCNLQTSVLDHARGSKP